MNTVARFFLISLLAVYSLLVSAQVPSLSGVVTDAKTHAPIGHAEVTAVGGSANSDVTDSDGKFVLRLTATVKPGDIVELRVRKSGYATYDRKVPVGGLALTIELQPSPAEQHGPSKDKESQVRPATPCVNPLKFEQQESVNYIGGANFEQRVTVFPRHFKGPVLPVVIFVGTAVISGGYAQGVMVKEHTGDPVAAGINVTAGRLGLITRKNNSAELYLQDLKKFSEAKAVVVNLYADQGFKIVCVQQPPFEQESVLLPMASSTDVPQNRASPIVASNNTQGSVSTAHTSGANVPAVGSITQGAGSALSINQQGGITAGVVNVDTSRRLSRSAIDAITSSQDVCATLPLVNVTASNANQEAQRYAYDFVEALRGAGCRTDLSLPIPGLTPDVTGVLIGVRDYGEFGPAAKALGVILSRAQVPFGFAPMKADFFAGQKFVLVIGAKE
jgi:hypothetical protein